MDVWNMFCGCILCIFDFGTALVWFWKRPDMLKHKFSKKTGGGRNIYIRRKMQSGQIDSKVSEDQYTLSQDVMVQQIAYGTHWLWIPLSFCISLGNLNISADRERVRHYMMKVKWGQDLRCVYCVYWMLVELVYGCRRFQICLSVFQVRKSLVK